MSDIAIRVENLSKVYKLYDKPIDRMKESLSLTKRKYSREHYALKDITFSVNKGEILGIIGVNGSGKSTLLKIITGVLSASSGDVMVNGIVSALLELGAGFNQEYTGMENIYLNGTMLGISREEIELRIPDILQFADIGEFIHQPVKTYSSGMFARLAFSVAISSNPNILIVDEVLAVGDTKFQVKCLEKIKQLQSEGTTILYVSHDIYSMRNFCNRVMWLNKGQFKMIGQAEDIIQKYKASLMDNTILTSQKDINSDIINIKNIYLNGRAEFNQNFVTGDELSIKIEYDLFEKINKLVIGIAILDIEGKYVSGVNTKVDKFEFDVDINNTNKVELLYPNLTLLPNTYYSYIAIFEANGITILEEKKIAFELNVISQEYLGEGYALFERKWRVY
ncbi:ABC transporter ATP-binding protein [Clostridium butyricum]|uniref:ABC transporter ATP-binding protein n=1 Tax=Clostridium butyricum TaxID=1492 RepID=UPI0005EBE282|nr:ABC transporter ATP-binding protein [Clostridium butyricum]